MAQKTGKLKSFVVKLLLGLLALSFAAWGVADVYTGGTRATLAKVGDSVITPTDYERAYQLQTAQLERQLQRQITSEEARRFGLPQRVVQNLVGAAAVSAHAKHLGLSVSESAVAAEIRSEQAFQDAKGGFDRQAFEQILRSNGLNEAGFVRQQQGDMIRGQLVNTIADGIVPPAAMTDALLRYASETRTLKFVAVPADSAALPTPTEAELTAFYDTRKRSFALPERRRIAVLRADTDTLKATAAVTDAELRTAYDAGVGTRFGTAERRQIEQLVFKDRPAAEAALPALREATDFAVAAEAAGFKKADIALGNLTRADIADGKVADAAFALETGKLSEPVDGAFGTVLLRVSGITPGTVKPFEEVRSELRDELAKQRAGEAVNDTHTKIEDERAAGTTLAETATKFGLALTETTIDAGGRAPDGQTPAIVTAVPTLPAESFKTDVGVEANVLQTPAQGFAWFEVLEIMPARDRTLEEARAEVVTAWQADRRSTATAKRAADLLAKVSGGETIEDVAGGAGLPVTTSAPVRRDAAVPGLPISAVAQAFATAKGAASVVQAPGGEGRVLFQVSEIKAVPADDAARTTARDAAKADLANDLLAQYVNGLQNALGVSLDAKAVAALTGGEAVN